MTTHGGEQRPVNLQSVPSLPSGEQYLTLKEAAQLLRLAPRTLKRADWPKRLRGVKVGHEWRFAASVVEQVLRGER
jgi:excisionase family DNA binding protein